MKLEIGCGTDNDYDFNPKDRGHDVIYADKDYPNKKIPSFVRCDASSLPFINKCFEEIYASHVIEHIGNTREFLEEMHRTLNKNGKLWVWTPNFTSPNSKKDRNHRRFYNYFSLRSTLKQNGFKVDMFLPFVPYKIFKPLTILLTNELHACAHKC